MPYLSKAKTHIPVSTLAIAPFQIFISFQFVNTRNNKLLIRSDDSAFDFLDTFLVWAEGTRNPSNTNSEEWVNIVHLKFYFYIIN